MIAGVMRRTAAGLALVACLAVAADLHPVRAAPAPPPGASPGASALVTVQPCRLYDSRAVSSTRVPARTETPISTLGRCGLPVEAVAVVVSAAITSPARSGFVSLWPTGAPQTPTSTLNAEAGETRANGAIVPVGIDGSISVSASVDAHIVIDVMGAFAPVAPVAMTARSGRFVATSAVRLLDTRVGGARPPAGSTLRIPLPPGVPPDATALAITVATADTIAAGFFTAQPAGGQRPATSSLNVDGPRQIRAAGQIVAATPDGIEVFTQQGDHVIVDYTGWFTGPSSPESTDGLFVPITPIRLIDTRTPAIAAGAINPGGTITVQSQSVVAGGRVAAIAGNWTLTETRTAGFVTAYPAGTPRPLAATVNTDRRRQNVAQFGIVAASTDGISVFSSNGTQLVVDATGWFTGPPVPVTSPPVETNVFVPDTARRVLLVGDSTLAGVRWYGNARHALVGSDFILDVESCRRLVGSSCTGREGRRPPNAVQTINETAGVLDDVVIMTGYNDWHTTFADAVDQVMTAARAKGAHRVIWLTYREGTAYRNPTGATPQDAGFRIQNQALRAKAGSGAYPDLHVADYDAYTRNTTGWYTSDGVHFTVAGAYGTADYISRVVAATHGERCPAPLSVGGVAASPCPHPDTHAAITDPLGLYAGNPTDIHCYEIGAGRQLACTVDPKLH